jgi:hypothetical protein
MRLDRAAMMLIMRIALKEYEQGVSKLDLSAKYGYPEPTLIRRFTEIRRERNGCNKR